jgi:hypothetical protein
MILDARRGHERNESLMDSSLWTSHLYSDDGGVCFTLSFDATIGTDWLKDELFLYLNESMVYTFYIHSPKYFLQNYNPLALPVIRGKVFPPQDCNSYLSLALTEQHKLSQTGQPCEETAEYRFVDCVEASLASKVGCRVAGEPACTTEGQYREYNTLFMALDGAENMKEVELLTECRAPCTYNQYR